MTKVDFHFNVAHKARKVVQLTHATLAKKLTLTIHFPDEATAQDMSQLLWTHDPVSFLPHHLLAPGSASIAPVVLDWHGQQLPYDDILINMTSHTPTFFSRFQKVIEIVGVDEVDKVAARERFKFYRDRGYEINTIDALTQE